MTLAELQRAYLQKVDAEESYRFAKRMEQFRSNPTLGFRTAGSRAEFLTGEMLLAEMEELGLQNVRKDPFTLDTWEFERARMCVSDGEGAEHYFELGGYQTNFSTGGWREFTLVDGGRGTAGELQKLDLRGKLVLVDINQRDDWWISYPVYQAHLMGAAAVVAVQQGGYGGVDSAALNAQNICGPADAPAFSLSRRDARALRALTGGFGGETPVFFDAESSVGFGGTSYNIVGEIPGADPESMILLSAHYDSYFSGFQDDNAAVALMLGIARALVQSGCRPRRTLVFCAMAAEEWGVSDCKYDWSTGAYNQIFNVRPEWRGRVIADLNFELPAYPHDAQDVIRCVYEYSTFLRGFADSLPDVSAPYPGGVGIASPVLTWSDDFSMAIAGVPSLVNDFAGGSFMETHYHSQFDNDDAYDAEIYRFHHGLFGALALALDNCAAVPLDFGPRLAALAGTLDPGLLGRCGIDGEPLLRAAQAAATQAEVCWRRVGAFNHRYAAALAAGGEAADALYARAGRLNAALLEAFQFCEDAFVRLTWHDDVIFPHEYAQQALAGLEAAREALAAKDIPRALSAVSRIDVNRYAFSFDERTCRHFTGYVTERPAHRLMWGAGRIPGLCDLSGTVRSLLAKRGGQDADLSEERAAVEEAYEAQRALLAELLTEERDACATLARMLANIAKYEGSA